MDDDTQQWLELPAGIVKLDGVLWVREANDVSLTEIAQAFRDGCYSKPFIHDDGEYRRLHFNFESTQSEMLVDRENELVFDYTKQMMSFLLFKPQAKHILIVGLGGGSMTKFCLHQLPDCRVTTLENDANVIALAPLFDVPDSSPRNQILHVDAASYAQSAVESFDAVLIDGCDADGTANTFYEQEFYDNLRRSLSPDGVVVINFVGDQSRKPQLLKTLTQSFGHAPIATNLDDEKNRLMFAFNDGSARPDWSLIKQRAEQLEQDHALDFSGFARKLQRAWRT